MRNAVRGQHTYLDRNINPPDTVNAFFSDYDIMADREEKSS